jgi:hypothetical protein
LVFHVIGKAQNFYEFSHDLSGDYEKVLAILDPSNIHMSQSNVKKKEVIKFRNAPNVLVNSILKGMYNKELSEILNKRKVQIKVSKRKINIEGVGRDVAMSKREIQGILRDIYQDLKIVILD